MSRIACIIPTYNGREQLTRLLDSVVAQSAKFDLFIVDSGSQDGTLEVAKKRVNDVTLIAAAEFNHGGTRQFMVDLKRGYDYYVFLTQDAYLRDPDAIEMLIQPFSDPDIGAVCGRQLPHSDATPLAAHARIFNYPDAIQVKSIKDVPRLGIKTAFISNSFAAYRGAALASVGGFPKHVIFAEDMYAVAKMLMAGWKVAYAGHACCRHSHNYTMLEEFRRYFDMGVFHARETWIHDNFGSARGEGIRYVKSELAFLGFRRIHMWPSAILRNTFKLLGYKLGQNEASLPVVLKRRLGMHRTYWDGPFARRKDN